MTPLDQESLQSKINRIRKHKKELENFAKKSFAEYNQDEMMKAAVERLLQISIQAMLDIGSHIIAEEGLGDPLEYRDIFTILLKAGILPKAKEQNFLNLVGLRNRIVHIYDDLDHEKIHQFLRENLSDFDAFLQSIVAYLEKK